MAEKRAEAGREPAYAALSAEAVARGLPRSFAADLTEHDRRWCAAHPGEPFGWVLHEQGTHLLKLGADRDLLNAVEENVSVTGSAQVRWYFYDGRALSAVSGADELEQHLSRARREREPRQWKPGGERDPFER
jgi:hypothetical protein